MNGVFINKWAPELFICPYALAKDKNFCQKNALTFGITEFFLTFAIEMAHFWASRPNKQS